ncbi:hypothetical protein RvY_04409 [Ramazzottius varieornatus]|uniref:Uncharacterized protein n=1 Tax=Ramazzottius varieornatus TaxID=947166 RepID=A0A1D1V0T0_RAMVA|nr:hypothetical protein RvY_04409 [Ramazzottius varieornatus]
MYKQKPNDNNAQTEAKPDVSVLNSTGPVGFPCIFGPSKRVVLRLSCFPTKWCTRSFSVWCNVVSSETKPKIRCGTDTSVFDLVFCAHRNQKVWFFRCGVVKPHHRQVWRGATVCLAIGG